MIRYKCRVSDSKGKISHIYKSVQSEQALVKEINDESLYLIDFKVAENTSKRRFSRRMILDFTDTMALMLESGLTIRDALKVSDGELVKTLSASLTKGISFPEAVDALDSDFPPIYRGLVKIGDRTGSMDEIFRKLSKYLNDEKQMQEKIQGALMYPVLVLSVLFMGLTAVFFFIFPRIKKTFATDTLDQVFERFQIMMTVIFVPMVLLIIFIIFLVIASKTTGRLKVIADRIMLSLPLIGTITSLRSTLNIMFSLEVLTTSGYPVEAALDESSFVLSNSVLSSALKRIRKGIIRGDKLSEAFSREKYFSPRISLWISVGEASGNISKVFSQLRTFFQGELDKITSRIMLLIEPILIVSVGIFMILFVILFVVPLFGIFGAAI